MSSAGTRRASCLLILISLVLISCTPARPAQLPQPTTAMPRSTAASQPVVRPVVQPTAKPAEPIDAAAVARQADKPQFVEFYSTICAICKQIQPAIYQLQDEYQDRVTFTMYDVAGINNEIKTRYQFIGYPQLVMINTQGEIIFSRLGFQTYDSMKADLDAVLKSSSQSPAQSP